MICVPLTFSFSLYDLSLSHFATVEKDASTQTLNLSPFFVSGTPNYFCHDFWPFARLKPIELQWVATSQSTQYLIVRLQSVLQDSASKRFFAQIVRGTFAILPLFKKRFNAATGITNAVWLILQGLLRPWKRQGYWKHLKPLTACPLLFRCCCSSIFVHDSFRFFLLYFCFHHWHHISLQNDRDDVWGSGLLEAAETLTSQQGSAKNCSIGRQCLQMTQGENDQF